MKRASLKNRTWKEKSVLMEEMLPRFERIPTWRIFEWYRDPDDPMILKELHWWLKNVRTTFDTNTSDTAILKGCNFNVVVLCMQHEEKLSESYVLLSIAIKNRKDIFNAFDHWDPKLLVQEGLSVDCVWMVEKGFSESLLDLFWSQVQTAQCLHWALDKNIPQKHKTTQERLRFIVNVWKETRTEFLDEVYCALKRYQDIWNLKPLPGYTENWTAWRVRCIMDQEGPRFTSLQDTLPFVKEFVHATCFEKEFIRSRFQGEWIDLDFVLIHNISDASIVFSFSKIGNRLVAFYYTCSSKTQQDVDSFIRSFGVRKTEADMF